MKWFMHESSAHRDTKLKKVLIKYGAEGYGLYWFCIEHICADVDPKLTFELEHDTEILAHELKIDTLKVQEILLYMVKLELFELSDNIIYCLKLARYMGDRNTRNPDLRAIIKEQKADLSRTVPDSPGQSRIVRARGEERRGDKNRTPTKEEDKKIKPQIEKTVIAIPTISFDSKGESFNVTEDMVEEWQATYPAMDVLFELQKAKTWSMDNPTKRKTIRGMRRFLGGWIERAHNKGSRSGGSQAGGSRRNSIADDLSDTSWAGG